MPYDIDLDNPANNYFPCPHCKGEELDEDCDVCDGFGEVSLSTLREYRDHEKADFERE